MTPLPAASPAPAPDLAAFAASAPDAPLCPEPSIWDGARIDPALAAALAQPDPRAARADSVRLLAEARAQGMAAIAEGFAARPFAGREATRAIAWLTDRLILSATRVARALFPLAPGDDRLALLAVGGYGRGEMAPQSDVDLMVLLPGALSPAQKAQVEGLLYLLWDLKLKVGHATRSIKEALTLARGDMTIRTSLLEVSHLAGDESLAATLRERFWRELVRGSATEFLEAKLAERAARHQKQGGQRYVVEPNVKEGKGGLRDLHSLFWIGKYVNGVETTDELVAMGVFTPEEFATFRRAESFLWAVRCHLHLITGRPVDQLTFDLQVEVARRMGYEGGDGRRAVERFMQDYFRHANRVGELTRIFLTALEAIHVKPEPRLMRLFSRTPRARPPYAFKQNRLAVADDANFLADPLNLLRIFEEALRTGTLLHPDAMRLVASNLHLIDDRLRHDPRANAIFLDLLLKHGNPERALRRMNELGALAAFLPEFEPIVAMMQFNMYHHFTVDEHIIQCISHLARIEKGELVEELPVASGILKAGVNRRVLYVALLLHDIGKGRAGDHSVIGAEIASRVAPRLGLTPRETETVVWLVRNHLLMSDVAQKRDISEPRTVRDFAAKLGGKERLDLLTVLTVCDIRGVGPGTWNNWKAMLLRALYNAAAEALLAQAAESPAELARSPREEEARRALAQALPGWSPAEIEAESQRHYGPYWLGLPTDLHVVFAHLLRGIQDDELRIDIKPDEGRAATRVAMAMVDHPGLFSRMTGALALVGANIRDARTYTSKDGYATAIFWIQDAEEKPFEESRLPRLRQMIARTLRGEVVAREALRDRDRLKKREAAFERPTRIAFDNLGSDIYTLIEVDTRDRPGLLYDLTRTLAANNVYIASAVVATYGEQAVDTFYVKDMFGLKFHSESRQRALERKLREAIEQGAARARE
ncbi:[protein-PII] uridylyltransferase [Rubellimicrobium aerolatum]|uniref:Bifunctional uridylyltransferase/uridylyl-removing enzyme n=1 Tax=Rubellimicrobium aerolatum TaxID=490979 RepID=A0ABW0S8W8_9RHOB|nr:[protein-PII] uridylyltransferase [Rubellimicrobium aerolatum]MBP1804717.1 [protein-PII] uridylyltransferase [Rubellimicrobium aerolatum]